ncbi:tRNA pseudouridine(13) synthase TruD [Campylobacter fetus]|uniref:tRNA pseudouridine(13) synthase TruD n=1 Tax=Campylobacter fetus TaxID=196 RepID=UPI0008187D74|nr:tRNA pseudouridine(13) synthase TruD [Campylobacter fetus]EAH8300110.1 tRNA pseudouridine(13) synthase TruD [Campylobacter fetus]EAI7232960.1 tRNA pseudouridine(13) synthase TruD [Campylobacter fetus]EAJ5689684.1 tRNA pseudouridine(13) synthase TruD [Campylobacter fetus]EAK0427961.1 tRNA pseudouridine(13) synthase TruD [Campylobacter fetus]EAK5304257.1 tRNA pseudouridine(13) synthase TruD [Campylobacter fetus]
MENTAIFKPLLGTTHSPINAHFSKNASDFVVRENPLYSFSGSGEHLVVEIQKKGMTTSEALTVLSRQSRAKMRDFGYAGLKDKEGMTTQFISMPAKFENEISKFSYENLKILSITKHNNKIRIGHLKSNSFFIRLKKVLGSEALKLKEALKTIDKNGYPNYFGYQRFGRFGDNANSGFEILNSALNGDKSMFKKANPKLRDFLISAYQSDLFNKWLSKRVEISRFSEDFSARELEDIYKFDKTTIKNLKSQKQFFKLFQGEVLGHYPFGKVFLCEDLEAEVAKFGARDRTSCGLIIGSKAYESTGVAKSLEDEIFRDAYKFSSFVSGSRRFAWMWIDNLEYKYNEESAQFSISFALQKGSYATVVLREILGRDIFEE